MSERASDEITFLRWAADDLQLLALLQGSELEPKMIQHLTLMDFPRPLVVRTDEDEKPISVVMVNALKEINGGVVTLDDLASDFAAIYLNVSYEASPNESAWLDEDHLERQEPMFEIRRWYEKYSLCVPNWRVRSEDNIALQLLFIAHLLKLESIPIRDLNHFMDFHLLRWIGDFSQKIFARAETAFYSSLALITARYVQELRNILAELEGRPRRTAEEVRNATKRETPSEIYDPSYYSSTNGGW